MLQLQASPTSGAQAAPLYPVPACWNRTHFVNRSEYMSSSCLARSMSLGPDGGSGSELPYQLISLYNVATARQHKTKRVISGGCGTCLLHLRGVVGVVVPDGASALVWPAVCGAFAGAFEGAPANATPPLRYI